MNDHGQRSKVKGNVVSLSKGSTEIHGNSKQIIDPTVDPSHK